MGMDFSYIKTLLVPYLRAKGYTIPPYGGKIRCFNPEHEDKEPSCDIQVARNQFKCYGQGCGINGDTLDAVALIEGIPSRNIAGQIKALEKALNRDDLSSRYKDTTIIEKSQPQRSISIAPDKKKATDLKAITAVGKYLTEKAQDTKPKLIDWLKEVRKCNEDLSSKMSEIDKTFYWPGFKQVAKSVGAETLKAAGIYPTYWGAEGVVFQLIEGFHYRGKEKSSMRTSRGSTGAKKFFKLKEIAGPQLVLVEGGFDTLSCITAGIPVMGTNGTNSINTETAKEIAGDFRRFSEIVILYDNDKNKSPKAWEAAKKNTNRVATAIAEYINPGTVIKIATIPVSGYDPDDMIREGKADELRECIKTAEIVDIPIVDPVDGMADFKPLFPIKIPADLNDEKIRAFFNRTGNADGTKCLNYLFDGKVIYADEEKQFYYFNGNRYIELKDIYGMVVYSLVTMVKEYCQVTPGAKNSERKAVMRKIVSTKWIKDTLEQFKVSRVNRKAVPWDGEQTRETLTLEDGVMDFTKKEISFRKGRADEYRKKFLPYTVEQVKGMQNIPDDEKCGKFLSFMEDLFPDKDTLLMATRYFSLAISGNQEFKMFGLLWGANGDNGKSTLIEILEKVLRGFVVKIKSGVVAPPRLAIRTGNEPTPEESKMEGMRLVVAGEPEKSATIDNAKVKGLTGGDTITARAMRKDPKDFIPMFQLCLMTNDLLELHHMGDKAMVRRIIIIPFTQCFVRGDDNDARRKTLVDGVVSEAPGILCYLCERYLDVRDNHHRTIPISRESREALEKYRKATETETFINECCVLDTNSFETTADICNAYRHFASDGGAGISDKLIIAKILCNFGELTKHRKWVGDKNPRGLLGLRLKPDAIAPPYVEKDLSGLSIN